MQKLASAIIDEDAEIVTIIYGEDVTEEEAKNLHHLLKNNMKMLKLKLYNGKQPLYPYILSVE